MQITAKSVNHVKWRTWSGLEYWAQMAPGGANFSVYRRTRGKPYIRIETHEMADFRTLIEAVEDITKEKYNY